MPTNSTILESANEETDEARGPLGFPCESQFIKTNKEIISNEYNGFVIYWIDYSPERKDPIKRIVRLSSSEKAATAIADKLVEDNVKKGWSPFNEVIPK